MALYHTARLIKLSPERLSLSGAFSYRMATHELDNGLRVLTNHVVRHRTKVIAELIGRSTLLLITMGDYKLQEVKRKHNGVTYPIYTPRIKEK